MKNPLALLKKAVVNVLKSPGKSLVTLLVLLDNISQAKANSPYDNCHEVVFTPTASGRSYTLEKRLTPCAQLEILTRNGGDSDHCVSGLDDYQNIYVSSLSDVPRTDPRTGNQISDTLGFAVSYGITAAMVKNNNQPARKVWRGLESPACTSISFFKTHDGAKEAPKIIDVSPTDLEKWVSSKNAYFDRAFPHCMENDRRPERSCKMEL